MQPALGLLGALLLFAGCATDPALVSVGTDPRIIVPQQDGIPRTLVWLEQTAGTERSPGDPTAYRKLAVRGATVDMSRTPPVGPIVSFSQSSAFISGPVACVSTGATQFVAWHDGTGLVGRFFDPATLAPLGSDPLLLTPEATSTSPVAPHEYDVAYDSDASQIVLVYVIGHKVASGSRQAWMRFITLTGTGLPSVGPAIAVGAPPQAWPRIAIASGSRARNLVLWIQSDGTSTGAGPIAGAVHARGGERVTTRDGSYQFMVPGFYAQVAGVFEPGHHRFLVLGEGGSRSTIGHVDGFQLTLDGDVPLTPGAKVADLVVRPANGAVDYSIYGWWPVGRPKVFALANGSGPSGSGSQPVLAYRISSTTAVGTSGIDYNLYDNWISTTTFPDVLAPGLPVSDDRTGTAPRTDMPRFFIGGGDLKPAADGRMLLFFEQLSGRPIRRGDAYQLHTPPSLLLRAISP